MAGLGLRNKPRTSAKSKAAARASDKGKSSTHTKRKTMKPAPRDPEPCVDYNGEEEDPFITKVHARPINGRYLLLHKLGQGGCATVFLARDTHNGKEVALKLEHHSMVPSILQDEANIGKKLSKFTGFAKIYWHGYHDHYRVMALELLGPSLDDLFAFCGHQFSLKTTLLISDQLLCRLEALCKKGIVHRDVKPGNCLLGTGTKGNVLYLTDFGLSGEPERNNDHLDADVKGIRLVGTARFASIRAHESRAQYFKDDLESLGYMLIYFLRGALPWQGLKDSGRDKYLAVLEQKRSISVKELCADLPPEFEECMERVHRLQYGDEPDYEGLRMLFRQCASREGIAYDNVFDWTVRMYLQQKGTRKKR